MDRSPDAYAAAVSSGDTDRVNRAIDDVSDLELEERAALFDPCFKRCRELFESANGYKRQSVVRFTAALYPRLVYRTVGGELIDEELPGDWTLEEAARHRRQLREFYFEALGDDDGRVRRAATKALKELAVAADVIGADNELESMLTAFETLTEDSDNEAVQKHVGQAYDAVAFHAEKRELFFE